MARTNGGIIGVKNSTSQGGGKQTLVTSTSNLCTQPGTRIVQALIVSGGGGGESANHDTGGEGGGPNVAGGDGQGNSGSGASVESPGDKIHWSGYPVNGSVRVMTRCGVDGSGNNLSCDTEVGASDVQNNGGFGFSGGGGGGSGVKGADGGNSNSQAGGGG